MSLIVRVGHVHFRGFRRRSHGGNVRVDRFLPQAQSCENMRGHVNRVRGIGSNFRVHACGYQAFGSKLGSIAGMNDVVGYAGMFRLADK